MSKVSIVRVAYLNVYEGIRKIIELSVLLDVSKHDRFVIRLN